MFSVNISIIPDGDDGYRLEINTDLPEEGLVKKILEECLEMWGERTSENFDDEEFF
jgi:hypothetical protein